MQPLHLSSQRPLLTQAPKPPQAPPLPPEFSGGPSAAGAAGNPFVDLVFGQVREVNAAQHNADQLVHQMLTGEDVNQAEVLTAVQKADMAFRMMLQMRNKLMDAYREVQQIQI